MTHPLNQLAARHVLTDLETGRMLLDVRGLLAELRRDEHQAGREATRENEGSDD